MIKILKSYFQEILPSGGVIAIRNNAIAKNAFSLYVIQFAEMFIPLITVPYVLRTLGAEGFGLSSFIAGLISYFAIFVDYGFSLSATREISIKRNDKNEVNNIFNSTIWAKIILFLIGLIILFFLQMFLPKISFYSGLFFLSYLSILGNVIFPVWLYQGMEQMNFLAVSSVITKAIMLCSIFVFIHNQNDVKLYVAILSTAQIINGFICFAYAIKVFEVRFRLASIESIGGSFAKSWALFIANASTSLYSVGNPFILGLFASTVQVGYFSAAEKIMRASFSLLTPIIQAVFPRLTNIASNSKRDFVKALKRIAPLIISLGLFISASLFIFSPQISIFISGGKQPVLINLIRVLAVIPFFVSINNVIGNQFLIVLGKEKVFTRVVLFTGCLNIIMAAILAPKYQAFGSALALLISEFLVVFLFTLYVLFNKDKIYKEDLT